jgi:hypothetical protein
MDLAVRHFFAMNDLAAHFLAMSACEDNNLSELNISG